MAGDMVPVARYMPVPLGALGVMANWVMTNDGPFLAVRTTCEEIGIAPSSEIRKLADDSTYNGPEVLRDIPVQTAGGRQVVKCLRRREAALWLATVLPRRVKPELRSRWEEVREQILQAADRLVFGDTTGVPTVLPAPAAGGVLHVGDCPRCHTPLDFVVRPGDMHLEIAR